MITTVKVEYLFVGTPKVEENIHQKTAINKKIVDQLIVKADKIIGDEITLLSRPYPDLTLQQCIEALSLKANQDVLKRMADNPILSENWTIPAKKVLVSGKFEDDSERLGIENGKQE